MTKILREGKIPKTPEEIDVYLRCNNCKSIITCKKSEMKEDVAWNCNIDLCIDCPFCNDSILFNAIESFVLKLFYRRKRNA